MSPRVIIVGTGIAGCTAAYELQKRGYAIELFEANGVVGGRLRTTPEGYELGGEIIGSRYCAVHRLAEELGVPMTKVHLSQTSEVMQIGFWMEPGVVVDDMEASSFNPLPAGFKHVPPIWALHAVCLSSPRRSDQDWCKTHTVYDLVRSQWSEEDVERCRDFLESSFDLPERLERMNAAAALQKMSAVEYLITPLGYPAWLRRPLLGLMQGWLKVDARLPAPLQTKNGFYILNDGNQDYCRRAVQVLRENGAILHLGEAVTSIQDRRVRTAKGVYEADAVVCAASVKATCDLIGQPCPFDMVPVAKLFFTLSRPLDDDHPAFMWLKSSWFQFALPCFDDELHSRAPSMRAIGGFRVYACGEKARRLQAFRTNNGLKATAELVTKELERFRPSLRGLLSFQRYKDWDDDFSQGGWPYVPAGGSNQPLALPSGVYTCGDHSHLNKSGIQSSVDSAVDAATLVHYRLQRSKL